MGTYLKVMTFYAVFLAAAVIISGCSSSKTDSAVSEDGSSAVAEDGSAKSDDAKKTGKTAKKKDEGSLLSQFDKSQLDSAKRRERYNDMSKQMDTSEDKVFPWKSDSENRSEQLRENKKSGGSLFYNW